MRTSGSTDPELPRRRGHMHGTVIVAVVSVRMVQVFVHHVVHVIAVRYRFMPAAGAVPVIPCMRSTGVVRRALLRVGPAHLEPMLFHAAVALVVQTPVVEVIDVAAMLEASMAAVRAVLMRMPFVNTGLRLSGRLHGSISLCDALEEVRSATIVHGCLRAAPGSLSGRGPRPGRS